LELKALSEAQVRARDAQDAKRAVIEVENEAIKAERELAARFAERENEARAASLRVTELELRLKTTETELMLTATALKASDQELVKIQKASGLMVAEMERATYAARRAEAQLYAAKQSQRTPAATTVAELRETQERLTEAQKQNSKLQAHAVESATELVKLREQVNAMRRSQEEASVRLDVQSGVTEREQERVEAATKKYHDAVREMESMRLAHQKTQARVVDLQQLVTRLEAQNTDSTYQTLAHQEGHRAEREALRAEIHQVLHFISSSFIENRFISTFLLGYCQLRAERVERRRGVDAESRQRSIMERSLQVAVEKHDNLKQHFNKLSLQIVEVNALNHQLSQHNAQLEAQCGRLQSQIETLMQRDIARATQGLVPTPPSGSATPRGSLPALPSARGNKPVFAFGMSSQLQAAKEQEDAERERSANAAIRDANRLRSLAAERLAELIAARQQFDAVSAEFEQLKEANEECKNRIKTLEQQRKHLAREVCLFITLPSVCCATSHIQAFLLFQLLRVQQRSNRAEAASTILEQALRRVAPDTAATVEFTSSPDAEPSSVLKEFVLGSK
jgi:DNA repair exonuclease SbcCD ATPase subunit